MGVIEKALVLFPVSPQEEQKLKNEFPEIEFRFTSESRQDDVSWADIIFGNPSVEHLKGCSHLQWIQLGSAGADRYTDEGALPAGTVLTNATGAYGLTISEHMMGMLLMLVKKLHLLRDNQGSGTFAWKNAGPVKTLLGATVLVIGAGNIGTEFAKRVKPFGCTVIGVRRTAGDTPEEFDEMHTVDELDSLLPRADVVALSLPGTKETSHIMNEYRLGLMKKDSVLLNVGRGTAVDTEALCRYLDEGKFWGIGLDVTEPEPLPSDHRLWRYPNVFISPHCSGGLGLTETGNYIRELFARNLRCILEGGQPENVVDCKTGYRKR